MIVMMYRNRYSFSESGSHLDHVGRPDHSKMMKNALLVTTIALLISIAGTATAQGKDEAARASLIETAFKYEGVPYVYGAESPQAFDCSGFVRYVYREAIGIELPRSARSFISAGASVDWREAKAGDVFVYDTVGGAPSHVSLYLGDGTVIHAVSDGPRTGVIVSPVDERYWAGRLIAARSFLGSGPAMTKAAPARTSGAIAKPVKTEQDRAIAEIGIAITNDKASFSDTIPTMAGTSVCFTLRNETGKDGSFTVLFFRIDPVSFKLVQIHDEKLRLRAGEALSLPPFGFDKAGKHKLVLKDSWGNQLFVREFTVTGNAR